jgi:hypothetical protein
MIALLAESGGCRRDGTPMKTIAGVLGIAYSIAFTLAVLAQQAPGDGPRFTGNALVRPADYREWVFLGSGLGMTYMPQTASQSLPQSFTNVFVNPSSYRSFIQTGKWPDKTILVVEVRASERAPQDLNESGRFQTSFTALEAHVKDSRFSGNAWAFFDLSRKDQADPLSAKDAATCVECHAKHAAVDNTFVQFYPTLLEIARQKGTLKPGF